jgi:hypothetical protein
MKIILRPTGPIPEWGMLKSADRPGREPLKYPTNIVSPAPIKMSCPRPWSRGESKKTCPPVNRSKLPYRIRPRETRRASCTARPPGNRIAQEKGCRLATIQDVPAQNSHKGPARKAAWALLPGVHFHFPMRFVPPYFFLFAPLPLGAGAFSSRSVMESAALNG